VTEPNPPRRGPARTPLWVALGTVAVVVAGATGVLFTARDTPTATVVAPAPRPTGADEPTTSPTPAPAPTPSPTGVPSYAMNGPGTYLYASGGSQVMGTAGNLRTYQVAIETGVPVPADDFAAMVDKTLGDPRSWIAGGDVRLQRVPGNAAGVNFTVMLVSPGTAQKLCLEAGLDIYWHGEPYSSCQSGQRAVINLSRYLTAVPDYGVSVSDYDQYAINHEVGHVLGHGHELCPGKGQPAPVMQQQTFDLQGCVANSWPYLNGKRYSGPPGRIVPTDNWGGPASHLVAQVTVDRHPGARQWSVDRRRWRVPCRCHHWSSLQPSSPLTRSAATQGT
jgi:hypothetical protein